MTKFEIQNLELMARTIDVYDHSNILAGIALFIATIAGILAYRTFNTISKQLESARWNALLTFEQDLSKRRQSFRGLARDLENNTNVESVQQRFEESKEDYLNAVERLSSSILNGQFPEDEMKSSYLSYIGDVVKTFQNSYGTATPYRKTVVLYKRWTI
ncbi:MAG: hypothetical protein H8E32_14795 [Nitrospinae bacterium]|nr:hypothetical protein [Nitrospinota bacterium]